jgi:hypothetical protein
MPAHSGASGPTTVRSIFSDGERDQLPDIVGCDVHVVGDRRRAGVARRAVQLGDQRRLPDLPAQTRVRGHPNR